VRTGCWRARGRDGNSEVGHQNIGAGRIVDQEIVRITKAIGDGEIAGNAVWRAALDRVKTRGTKLHFLGLASDAGVHSLLEHLYGLLRLAKEAGVTKDIFIHAFMDGRDTPPASGLGFIRQLEAKTVELGVGQVASVCGRFYAMDRDNRWERVSRAYNLLVGAKADATAPARPPRCSSTTTSPQTTHKRATSLWFPPGWSVRTASRWRRSAMATASSSSTSAGIVLGNSAALFCEAGFKEFDRGRKLDLYFVGLTEYKKGLPGRDDPAEARQDE